MQRGSTATGAALDVTAFSNTAIITFATTIDERKLVRRRGVVTDTSHLMAALALAQGSVAWQILGDSTGNGNTEWVNLTTEWLTASFPAYTVDYGLWNTTTIDYEAPVRRQTGPNGERYVPYSSASISYESDSVENSITGDIDIRMDVSSDNWDNGSDQVMVAKGAADGNRSFWFRISSAGTPQFFWTANGTTLIGKQPSSGWTLPANGARKLIRVTLSVDNGASGNDVKFYDSTDDGATWSQIGPTLTTAGTTTIYDSTAELQLGGRGGASAPGSNLFGRIDRTQVRKGISGPLVAPGLPELWSNQGGGQIAVGSPVLTILNGSHPGADIELLGATVSGVYDSTRVPRMTPRYGQALVTVVCSHNDGIQKGEKYLAKWSTLFSELRSKFGNAGMTLSTQNARKSPAGNIVDHAVRTAQLLGYANRNSIGVTDAAAAMSASGETAATLILSDGIHPTDLASGIWRDEAVSVLLGGDHR
ncbi:SGNH/GDSL hydrolase family protein [Cryobacterium sp. Y11]|uniref:SGNH/GDSL hydrolase family protein n=1 Tax=Cryobacterium sp. Y11 TaxID=2045016 RepID=UPI000CE39F49|nr:SGNH/GDSL hydrolase family protein [Cryobacterium sp. Y11]